MVRLLTRLRFVGLAAPLACSAAVPATETLAGVTSDSSSGTSIDPDSGSATPSESTSDEGDSTSTGSADVCPEPDPAVLYSGAGVLTPDGWPENGTIDAECSATEFTFDPTLRLHLSCLHPETSLPQEVFVRFSSGSLATQLDDLPGTTGLRLSFFNPGKSPFGCSVCGATRMVDAEGDLVFLSRYSQFDSLPADGSAIDVSSPMWLDPQDPAYETWSAPLDRIEIRDAGCAARSSLRAGAEFETPLAIDFTAGDSAVTIYDLGRALGVEFGGQRFDIIVGEAFLRSELNCGNCSPGEASLFVVRSQE